MKQLHPTSNPEIFHFIEIDGDEGNYGLAHFYTPAAAKARRVLERINILHGEAARYEAQGLDPAFVDRRITKLEREL